jgi:hypothetical protein
VSATATTRIDGRRDIELEAAWLRGYAAAQADALAILDGDDVPGHPAPEGAASRLRRLVGRLAAATAPRARAEGRSRG